MFKMSTGLLFNFTVVFIVGFVGFACEDQVGIISPDGARAVDKIVWGDTGEVTNAVGTADALFLNPEVIGDHLRAELPNWDTELFLSNGLSAAGFSAIDPVGAYEIAKSRSSSSFYFTEFRANGRTVFKNDNGETVKFNEEQGYWKFISNESIDSQRAAVPLTNDQARSLAGNLFMKFGLDEKQKGEEFSVGIGTATEGDLLAQAAQPIGRYVRIHRQLNGVEVFDSYLSTIHELDGNLTSLEIRWPEVKIVENCTLMNRDEFVSLVLAKHLDIFSNIVVKNTIASRLLYVYNETSGEHIPALQMNFQSGMNELTKRPNQMDLFVSLCKEDETSILF